MTVAIVGGNHRKRLHRALESVLQQDGPVIEVLLLDLSTADSASIVPHADPRVRTVSLPPPTTFGQARAVGVREARAPVVAFLEEHCVALPGWARELAVAHQGPWACVGSEIHNLNPGVGWSDAVHLGGYSNWMPPAMRGETATTAAHNSSYKRAALADIGTRLSELLVAEPLLQRELARRGHRLLVEPESKLAHENETHFRSLMAVWWWNRSYGRIRAREASWGWARRIIYLAFSMWIPWYRWARQLGFFVRRRRSALGRFAWNSPRIIILGYLAAAGLAVGALAGRTGDDLRFTDLELRTDEER
ncbi:MAG: glycosyltransferase family 2 protein [Anaerolineales bacterium]|nr:glycosyltransferase family 2 protein [Anaerolineales bacterium]